MSLLNKLITLAFRAPRQAAIDKATAAGEAVPIQKNPISVEVQTLDIYDETKNEKGEVTAVSFNSEKAQAGIQALFQAAAQQGDQALANLYRNLAEMSLRLQSEELKSFFGDQDPSQQASLEGFDPAAFSLVTLLTSYEEREGPFELTTELAKLFAEDYAAVLVEVLGKKPGSPTGHLMVMSKNFKPYASDLDGKVKPDAVRTNRETLQLLLDSLDEYNGNTKNEDAKQVGKHYRRKLHNLLNPRQRKAAADSIGELQFE